MGKWWAGVGMGMCGLVVLGLFGISATLGMTGLCLAAALLKLDELVWLGGGAVVCWCCTAEGKGPAIVGHFLFTIFSRRRTQLGELYFHALFRDQLPPCSAISENEGWLILADMTWSFGPMLIAAFIEPDSLCRFAMRLQRLPPNLRSLAYFITDIQGMLMMARYRLATSDLQTTMTSPYCSVFASIRRHVPEYSISKSFLPPLPNLESAWPLNPLPLLHMLDFKCMMDTTTNSFILWNYQSHMHDNQVQAAAELRRLLLDTNMGRLFYASFRLFLPWAATPFSPVVAAAAAVVCESSLEDLHFLVEGDPNWPQEGGMMGPGGEGAVNGLWNRHAAAVALRDRLPPDFATTLRRVSLSPACPPSLRAQAGTLLAYLRGLAFFPINAGDIH